MAEYEGFICPLCMTAFRDVPQLEQHFREEHAETTQSRFRSNIKNIFSKFKRRTQDSGVAEEDGAAAVSTRGREGVAEGVVTNVSGIDPEYWEPQEFGYSRNLMMPFKRIRDSKTSQTAAETNRLIIRIEKLFKIFNESSPRTAKAMRELEQSVVPWKPDKEEKRCMSCGRGFNLRRRKHHCRLCGDIICKDCSQFMTLSHVYPVLSDCPNFHSLAPPPRARLLNFQKKRKNRRQRKEEEEEEEEEEDESDGLRMCGKCLKLMHRKLLQLQTLEKPLITALYEKMQMVISEADSKKPFFLDMAESLLAGEHGYRLQDAARKRQQLIKLYETIDAISKDIMSLAQDCAPDQSGPSQRAFKLCRGVRVYASNYLQDNLLTLPSLPTAHKLAEIREQREKEAMERLRELERQRELKRREELSRGPAHAMLGTPDGDEEGEEEEEEDRRGLTMSMPVFSDGVVVDRKGDFRRKFEKLKSLSSKVTSKVHFKKEAGGREASATLERLNSGSGWMGDSMAVGSVDSQEDPFHLQHQQLRRFIQQAREAGRMDEVATLEQSLRDIEGVMNERNPQSLMSYGFD